LSLNRDDIQSRATIVNTKDGRQVVIPNAVLFTNPVAVETAAAKAA
jgi:small-conductance mechanosensitive channel